MTTNNAKFVTEIIIGNGHVLRRTPRGDQWDLYTAGQRVKTMREFEVQMIDAALNAGMQFAHSVK